MTPDFRQVRTCARVAFALCLLAVCAGTQAAGEVEAELLAIQHQWAKARIDGDVQFLERLYAREFWISAMNGTVVTREADIGTFASRETKPETISNEGMKVSVYDSVAIVSGIENVKGTYKGMPGDFAMRFTNVYVHRDGRWQMVTHHSTPIPK